MGDHCYRGTGSSVLCHFISYFVFCKSSPHALHLISVCLSLFRLVSSSVKASRGRKNLMLRCLRSSREGIRLLMAPLNHDNK